MDSRSLDAWFDALTDEELNIVLAQFDDDELTEIITGVPAEFQASLEHAYTTFGFFGGVRRKAEDLREQAKQQLRDVEGKFRDMRARIGAKVGEKKDQIGAALKKVPGVGDRDKDRANPISDIDLWRGADVSHTAKQKERLEKYGDLAEEFLRDAPKIKMEPLEGDPPFAPANVKHIAQKGRVDGTGTEDDPIDVQGDMGKAIEHLYAGRHVRLNKEQELSTLRQSLLDEMTKAREAKDTKKLKAIEEMNFCDVTVANTSIFCAEHKGFPRAYMPQGKGEPIEGSRAMSMLNKESQGHFDRARKDADGKLVRDADGHMIDNETGEKLLDKKGKPAKLEADTMEAFEAALLKAGYTIVEDEVEPDVLKATQSQIAVDKVIGMSDAIHSGAWDPRKGEGILVAADGSIIDGHHTAYGQMLADAEDGAIDGKVADRQQKLKVKVIKGPGGEAVDSLELLEFMNSWSKWMGIKQKAAGKGSSAGPR